MTLLKSPFRYLLSNGASTRRRTGVNSTPLHLAAQFGHSDVARLLVDAGASVRARDGNSWTPAQVAQRHGHKQLAGAIRG